MIDRLRAPGKQWLSDSMERAALAWLRTLGRRPGDTYLCSYPKSGRTWLRFMISAYQLGLFRIERQLTLANFFEVSPNLAIGTRMGPRVRMPHAGIVRVYGTHLAPSLLLRDARVIYLERDLRDVLVSYYHHLRARDEIGDGLEDFIRSDSGLRLAVRYLRAWRAAERKHVPAAWLRVQYEAMLADPAGELRRCLEFLGLAIDLEILQRSVELATVDNLRALEEASGNPDFSAAALQSNPGARHVRKARAGTHREEMSPALARRIEDELRRQGLQS